MTKYSFEATLEELTSDLDSFVERVFESLESEFLVMPRGKGFVDYVAFEGAYQRLRIATDGFSKLEPDVVLATAREAPLALIVLRCILGVTPPEWAYIATLRTQTRVSQGFARTLDRKIRLTPSKPPRLLAPEVNALVTSACELIANPVEEVGVDKLHRLDKADTREGLASLQHLSALGAPYAMLLYERFLGRPFAGHRDSVSELVGGGLETRIEETLAAAGITFRKTKRAERIAGFDQAPDFVIPDEFSPAVVIEAKLTEDDGTARDKVTRVQHLASIRQDRLARGESSFEVVACIAGRGFGVRSEDMRKLLLATAGKFVASAAQRPICSRMPIERSRKPSLRPTAGRQSCTTSKSSSGCRHSTWSSTAENNLTTP